MIFDFFNNRTSPALPSLPHSRAFSLQPEDHSARNVPQSNVDKNDERDGEAFGHEEKERAEPPHVC